MFGFVKRRLERWVAPKAAAEKDQLAHMLALSMVEADALRSALVLKHQQAVGGMQTLVDVIGGLMLSQGAEEVTLSGDLLASASSLGGVDMTENDDGSVTIVVPDGRPPEECDHCACEGEGDCGAE